MTDVVDLIMQDHREVERLFDQLARDRGSRATTTPVLITLLTAHSRAEESEVYPAARDEAHETDEVSHSQEEHLQADRLLAELAECDPESKAYDDTLAKVVEAVTHHVEEEESSVLPGLRDALSRARLVELGEAFLASRAVHLGEEPADITRDEMARQAANADLPVGDKSKQQLADELDRRAQE